MEIKRVSALTIKFNNGTSFKIQEKKQRAILDKISNKYHNLLKKYKIKELTSATNEN